MGRERRLPGARAHLAPFSVLAPIAVTVAEESKSFHTSRPEQNLGLQLASLVPTNAKVLAEGIHAKMTALMTNANFGADVVIGTAANFDAADLPAILALGKNYDQVRLLLDGGHLGLRLVQACLDSARLLLPALHL